MKKFSLNLAKSILGLALIGLLPQANATLIDRGNGLIYDDVQDITWLQDANYAHTSGYAAANLENDGGNDDIFADGRMGWDAAMTWASGLVYEGFDDWRLFNPNPSDANTVCSDYNCTSSELGHLFYVDLGLSAGQSILDSTDPDFDLFSNLKSYVYWSGTEYAPLTSLAWTFRTAGGGQYIGYKSSEYYAWAVRSGDVGAIPEPSILLLLGVGLAGLGFTKRAAKRRL